jgi:uncharacterized membrane protein YphA (DoxX/SURF4 family)
LFVVVAAVAVVITFWRQLAAAVAVFMLVAVVVVAAAADYCCGGDGSVQLLKTINWSFGLILCFAGVIVMKGEFHCRVVHINAV